MKDAYTEITLDEFKSLSDEERQFATFMTLKETNDCLKKKCANCPIARNQKWIIRIGAALIGWLSILTFKS